MNNLFHGYLMFTMLTGALLALPITWLLLQRYRNQLIKLMGRNNAVSPPMPEKTNSTATTGINFQINLIDQTENGRSSNSWSERQKEVVAIYGLGVLIYAATVTAFQFMADTIEFMPGRFGVVTLVHFWPFLLIWPFISGVSGKKYKTGIGIYLVTYFFISALLMEKFDAYGLLVLLGISNLLPTIMVLLLLIPRLRAAGIVVLVLTSFFMAGAYGLPNVFIDEEVRSMAAGSFNEIGIHRAGQMYIWLNILGALAGITISWLLIRFLGNIYHQKLVSDKSILIDGIMLYFSLWMALILAYEGIVWFFLGIGAFLTYKIPVYYLLRSRIRQKTVGQAPKKLLILRVFALGERSDRLFRRISRFWRLLGPVQVISGPDLANSTIEPHEFMDFLTGRLSRQFLESEEEINRKVAYLDDQPSADGNYGINDFYAYNSSWKSVLAALVETTDRIIMDIRSFSPGHQGCIHEIKELFRRISIKKVLFIIDRNTDWQFMEKTFQEACSEIQKGEINDIPDGGLLIINIYRLEGEDYSVGELLESIESPEIIVSH